jgi:hypothetical protein
MANNGALLISRATVNAGAQVAGIAAQYQKQGTVGTTANIKGYDSGNILGTVPPGKPGIKLVDGTIQNATKLVCNNSPLGNTLPSTAGKGLVPTVNVAQAASAGLSLAPEHE